jgi:hypothetical protein
MVEIFFWCSGWEDEEKRDGKVKMGDILERLRCADYIIVDVCCVNVGRPEVGRPRCCLRSLPDSRDRVRISVGAPL